jgi:hypothetical protein
MKLLTAFVPHEVIYMALFLLSKFVWNPFIVEQRVRSPGIILSRRVSADVRLLALLVWL